MRLFVDTAAIDEIAHWAGHPWVSGFTTNPTLMKHAAVYEPMEWAKLAVEAADGKPISIDGPDSILDMGTNVWRKIPVVGRPWQLAGNINWTAVCGTNQLFPRSLKLPSNHIISVFAGRIMDTGRDPQPVIDAAKATGAQVLWASCREPYNIIQAERAGCDIITVPPAILEKWIAWQGKPLEVVAEETITQFQRDAEGLVWQ